MKFPYGISDFNALIREGYFYADRTDRIPKLEETGKYLLFIRPRRFGKSLLLSMLANYYDIGNKDQFSALFGDLAAGKHPTPLASRYLVLWWDFSCVDPIGTVEDIRQRLHDHVNDCIEEGMARYESLLERKIRIHPENAISSLNSFLTSAKKVGIPVYLFIDEYDNFANEIMTREGDRTATYDGLVRKEGALKTLFKAVKSATGKGGLDRIFITGVSPIVLSDMTSGFNIAEDIYLKPEFNDLCGFSESEVETLATQAAAEGGETGGNANEAVSLMRTFYNGYTFSPRSKARVYNPTLALFFLKEFQREGRYPQNMLDANLAMDLAKLEYAAALPNGRQMLLDIARETGVPVVPEISGRFGLRDMLDDSAKGQSFLASFLYYFGVLTIAEETVEAELKLGVPNLVARGLYVEKIAEMLLPEAVERDDGRDAAKKVFQKGDMAPLAEFVETRYFQVFRNRDYRWANELTVKTAFLTLLYNDILYIMDSERETGRGYPDLTMIIRPDMRRFQILDVLIEFKFVTLNNAGMTGEAARELAPEELQKIPAMVSEMETARDQLKQYGDALEKKHGNLRLRRFAVVSLGFERIWWEAVDN
jgi:hypothetical protein